MHIPSTENLCCHLNNWGRRLEAADDVSQHALVPTEVGGHTLSSQGVEAVVPAQQKTGWFNECRTPRIARIVKVTFKKKVKKSLSEYTCASIRPI